MPATVVLLVDVAPETESMLRAAIPEATFEPVSAADVRSAARDRKLAVAVVSAGSSRDHAFRAVEELAASHTRIVAIAREKDPDLILAAMRAGAHEFVLEGETERLVSCIRAQVRPPRVGQVVTVFAAKGGVGATSIAVNLGGFWARDGKRACLLDMNLELGDVLGFLDLTGGYSISDVIANLGRLDRELLDASAVRHGSGVHVLAQSHKVESGERVDASLMNALMGFLRQHYDVVIVDGLRGFDELALTTLDLSDAILVVFTQEVPAVRNAYRCIGILRRLGHGEPKLRTVVNRYTRQSVISNDVIAETTGMHVGSTIVNDYPAMARAIQHGAMLLDEAPQAESTRDLEGLYRTLSGAPLELVRKKSLLGRLLSTRMANGTR